MPTLRSRSWILISFSLIIAGGVAAAEPNKPNRGRPHQVVPTGADDQAGAPAPDAAAEAELDQMTSRSAVGLTPMARFDGTIELDLEGRFMSVMVAGPDGRPACHGTRAGVRSTRHPKPARRLPARRVAPRPAIAPTAPTAPTALEVM